MDVERTMQFILEHQASHAAAISKHDEMFKEQLEVNRQIQVLLQQVAEVTLANADTVKQLGRDIEETRRGLEEARHRDDALREDLNALIKIADGLVRDRNDKTGPGGSNAPAV